MRYGFYISFVLLILFTNPPSFEAANSGKDSGSTTETQTQQVGPDHEDPHWTYEGETGPENWGKLSPEWSSCSTGRNQSPTNIGETVNRDLPAVKADFEPAELSIIHHPHIADAINTGHTIQINYSEGDTLTVGSEQFQLLQYHFHSPSEHTVEGKHYPMEMHLVHKSDNGKLAVIGVFIDEGKHNPAFDPIWSNLPKSKGMKNHFENVLVDVDRLLPARRNTFRYEGSLTTPPCSEGVEWILMTTPIQLSSNQIGAFKSIVKNNNRPVQPLNGRKIVTDHLIEN